MLVPALAPECVQGSKSLRLRASVASAAKWGRQHLPSLSHSVRTRLQEMWWSKWRLTSWGFIHLKF